MLKSLLVACSIFICFNSWSWSGRETWKTATRNQKLYILNEYRIFFAKNPEVLGEWEKKKTSLFEIIKNAYAAELDCIFAGWPSLKVGEKCAPPSIHNPAYQNGKCADNEIQCQPLLFGEGHCVSVATSKDRSLSFGRCQTQFAESGKSYEDILKNIENSNKEIELLALMDFADKACSTGFQASLYICRRLESVVDNLKRAQDLAKKVAAKKEDTEDVVNEENKKESSSVDVELATEVAVALNETVKNATALPTECPPKEVPTSEPTEKSEKTRTVIPDSNEKALDVYSPQQALVDLNSGNLKFVGRGLMAGNDRNRTCVFKNERAFVLYNNCMSSRRESIATDIEIISFEGDSMRFYILNHTNTAAISTLDRSQYDGSWTIEHKKSEALNPTSSLAQIQAYKAKQIVDYKGACWVGNSGGARGVGEGKCHGNKLSQQDAWAQKSESFWKDPGAEWLAAKKLLREKARTTPF